MELIIALGTMAALGVCFFTFVIIWAAEEEDARSKRILKNETEKELENFNTPEFEEIEKWKTMEKDEK